MHWADGIHARLEPVGKYNTIPMYDSSHHAGARGTAVYSSKKVKKCLMCWKYTNVWIDKKMTFYRRLWRMCETREPDVAGNVYIYSYILLIVTWGKYFVDFQGKGFLSRASWIFKLIVKQLLLPYGTFSMPSKWSRWHRQAVSSPRILENT